VTCHVGYVVIYYVVVVFKVGFVQYLYMGFLFKMVYIIVIVV